MPVPVIKSLTKEESDNLFFKAANFLNRSNSAVMGAASEAIAGRDPLAAMVQSVKGEKVYGGQDVMAGLFGGSPDDKLNRRVGLGLDILNPLDPLNYIGVGGLTKAGKAAKVLRTAADTIGAQTKLGERGLVTFMGNRVPLPGDAALMGLLGKGGTKLVNSRTGKAFKKNFGGVKGFVEAEVGERSVEFLESHEKTKRMTNLYKARSAEYMNAIDQNLLPEDKSAFLSFADGTGKDPGTVMDEAARFVGSGKNADKRRKVADAYLGWHKLHSAEAQKLGTEAGMGIGAFSDANQRFLSHYIKHGGDDVDVFDHQLTGEKIAWEGPENNRIQWALTPRALQPIERASLTDAGKAEYDKIGVAGFEKMRKDDPKAYIEFNNKSRMTIEEQDNFLVAAGGLGLVTDIPLVMKLMGEDLVKNMNAVNLVDDLHTAGFTKYWDDLSTADRAKYMKVSAGKYSGKPLAVPRMYERAIHRLEQAVAPSPSKPLIGKLLAEALPPMFQNLGIMPWIKGLMIYGGGPLPYLSRNLATGVHKNMVEGMGFAEAQRLYPTAARAMAQLIEGDTTKTLLSTLGVPGLKTSPLNMTGDFGKGVWTSKYGTQWDMRALTEAFMQRGMHGGGDPMREIIDAEKKSGSWKARKRLFGGFHKAQFTSEVLNRFALMLHSIEEVEGVYRKAGKQIPQMIDPVGATKIGDFADVALTNAKEAVIRAHFDYDDLTPFEKELRDRWIPFYTWMRKNIPNESVNMIQNFGKYMPYVRAYSNTFEQQGLTPEDLPEWAANAFSMPIEPDEDERARWIDWTGWLPQMDVLEAAAVAGQAVGAMPRQHGKTPQSEMLRYLMIRMNPLVTMPIEQAQQKDLFTGRSFSGDTPSDVLGLTVGAPAKNALELVRPITELDRLNPGNIFGATPRPHRNEPGQAQRIMRSLTGIKVRATDQDEASMSRNNRVRYIGKLRNDERKALKAGDVDGAAFVREKRLKLEKGLR